jgi:hypothetical protein
MRLDVGAGPYSDREVQIDIYKYPKTTYVMDAMMEVWPVESNFFREVRMEQFLEHCPPCVKYKDGDVWKNHYPIVHCMSEAYRVLVPGGHLHCSVPSSVEAHSQDPTHIGPIWTEGRFNYFCGQWGGGDPGSVSWAYGITFQFQKISVKNENSILTVVLRK